MTSNNPNLLIIMSDEHQTGAMGCAGHPIVKTPNLDTLAKNGTYFTNAYTPAPICVPARQLLQQAITHTKPVTGAMPTPTMGE